MTRFTCHAFTCTALAYAYNIHINLKCCLSLQNINICDFVLSGSLLHRQCALLGVIYIQAMSYNIIMKFYVIRYMLWYPYGAILLKWGPVIKSINALPDTDHSEW